MSNQRNRSPRRHSIMESSGNRRQARRNPSRSGVERMRNMRVNEVMRRPIIAVRHDDSVREAALMLTELGYAALPVLTQDDRLIGVVTSGDLLRAGELDDTVDAVMTTPAVSVSDSAALDEVMRWLLTRGLRSLPVIDADGRVVGMFSRGDALRIMLTPDDALAADAQNILDQYTGVRRWHVTVEEGDASISGRFTDESERRIAIALIRTVPGIRAATVATTPAAAVR
ncbi:CBS domain-containing protein [Nocardia amikacinitolerans]|nr:CBS domain-containing protein [Nocardia amikacinitolerans]